MIKQVSLQTTDGSTYLLKTPIPFYGYFQIELNKGGDFFEFETAAGCIIVIKKSDIKIIYEHD